ncbi:MAG: anti-sigma factor [Chloracidobacterium sp.]|nr:anti-sigma factor [Chloracidobacterium sp.]
MSCQDRQDLIHAYLDGALDLVGSLEMEQRLRDCQECSQAYQNYEALRSAITAGSLYYKSPAHLQKRIQSAVGKGAKAEIKPQIWSRRRLLAVTAVTGGFALAVLAILTWRIPVFLTNRSTNDLLTQEVVSSHVRSLMADHLTDVSSSDQHTVKPWFNGKLDFSPPVKDLADRGFPLVGGRLDYLSNRPAAALVYHRQRHFINLFIWPSSSVPDKDERTGERQGYNLIHWTRAGMTFWAISDLNAGELQEFVRILQT